MPFRWRSPSAILCLLLILVFLMSRNDRLKAVVITNLGHESQTGEPTEAQFDDKLEVSLVEEMKTFYTKLKKSKTHGTIYTPTLKNFTTNAAIIDQIRYPGAIRHPATNSSFSHVSVNAYAPQYVLQDKKHWAVTHAAKFENCGSPWRNVGIPEYIKTFVGELKGFPSPALGDRDALDWEKYTCFDRHGRFRPYGYTESEEESENKPEIRWESVNWGALQDHCLYKNVERFPKDTVEDFGKNLKGLGWLSPMDRSHVRRRIKRRQDPSKGEIPRPDPNRVPPPPVANRTAVLIRTRYDTVYRENDVYVVRALINELSLKTGGEYQIYLLVEVEDCDDETWTNPALYDAVLAKSVPPEFIEIAHIYTERLLRSWYTAMPSHAETDGPVLEKLEWLPIQRFAHLNPSFEYFWNWDLNVRFTGHFYDLATSLQRFAQRQPRKLMWERNERLAIPGLDGPYETAFRDKVEREADPDAIVWDAPVIPEFVQQGPRPPPELAKNEHFMWGVGEKADLVSLFPIFNPIDTTWGSRNSVWGYKHGKDLPRRAATGTFSIVSKKLLDLMHKECLAGRFLDAQMAGPTVAMLHGLKAVYAPQPIWFEDEWKGEDLRKYFNSGPRNEVGSGQKSLYGGSGKGMLWEGSTFSANSKAAAKLWDKWMGVGDGAAKYEKEHGRMCLPPMLLFPVQDKSPVIWTYTPQGDDADNKTGTT